MIESADILTFWFEELTPKQHFVRDENLDRSIIARFGDIHAQARGGKLAHWRQAPQGRLAEIIILDQFSRNMHRDDAAAWAQDAQALFCAREAVASGDDLKIPEDRRSFVYMPYMHSESAKAHEEAVGLFKSLGNELILKYEHKHKLIIDEFGRYPYRNEILGRESTPEEMEWLKSNESF